MPQKVYTLVLLVVLAQACGLAWEPWQGELRALVEPTIAESGSDLKVTLALAQGKDEKGQDKLDTRAVANRPAQFYIMPWRFNLFSSQMVSIDAQSRANPGEFAIKLPALPAGWYALLVAMADDKGELLEFMQAPRHLKTMSIFAVRQGQGFLRLHTERHRCVFSPGEAIRFFVSGRGRQGINGQVSVTLEPRGWQAKISSLAKSEFRSGPGEEKTLAFDLPPGASSAIAPGLYDLTVYLNGKEADRYALLFVSGERLNPCGRVWHSLLYDKRSHLDTTPAMPWHLEQDAKWMDNIGNANTWICMSASNAPLLAHPQSLPGAAEADLPPACAEGRPSAGLARCQMLMARGVSLIIHNGWAEDGSENYMPLPTIHQERMDLIGRKYLMTALSLAQFPNFTGLYTDIYSKPDWHGGSELTAEESEAIRRDLYEGACRAAGLAKAPEPEPVYYWNKKLPNRFKAALGSKDFPDMAAAYVQERYGGDWQKLASAPPADQAKAWEEIWARAAAKAAKAKADLRKTAKGPEDEIEKKQGADDGLELEEKKTESPLPNCKAPAPDRHYPFPRPQGLDLSQAAPDADLRYIAFVQTGISRCYAAINRFVERELPAAFTIHNRRRENHRDAGYSFSDWTRGPSVPPEFCRGATVIFSSEWNLDGEPQFFNGPTHYCQTLVDEGRPVWATSVHCRNGGQGRFLRDAVFLSGRGVTPIMEEPGNATWSFKGADQSAYAARDRLAGVIDFLNHYEDLFTQLEAVREAGVYVGPFWTDIASYVALPSALFAGFQAHIVCHDDAMKGALKHYKAILVPWLPVPNMRPSLAKTFREFIAAGGKIVAAVTSSGYLSEETLRKHGVEQIEVSEKDDNGSERKTKIWRETMEQRCAMAREALWQFAGEAVEIIPYDFGTRWAYVDNQGRKQSYSSNAHWTKSQVAANMLAPALEAAPLLKTALGKAITPLVEKDREDVVVCAMKPRDAHAQGIYLFVSSFALPRDKAWTDRRAPSFFWTTWVGPAATTLKIKREGIGAVYDLMSGREVPTRAEGDRLAFDVDLGAVEGRVYALLPKQIAGATLEAPARAKAGELIKCRFILHDDGGRPLPVLSAVRLRLVAESGQILYDLCRARPANGDLPALPAPANAGTITLKAMDTIGGWEATTKIEVEGAIAAAPAQPITLYAGDRIHGFLQAGEGKLRVVVASGEMAFGKEGWKITAANPDVERDKKWAQAIAKIVEGEAVESKDIVTGYLRGHPWNGGGNRSDHTLPRARIEAPAILVGSPRTNAMLAELERSAIAPRSLMRDNVADGRAVIAFLPRAFSPHFDAIIVAADDEAGFSSALALIASLRRQNPGPDAFYLAREYTRWLWTPAEVRRFKIIAGINIPPLPLPAAAGGVESKAQKGAWQGCEANLGVHIFGLDASQHGVAVATTSLVSPVALVSPQGKVVFTAGGGNALWPRDIAASADGKALVAGFALEGATVAYGEGGREIWRTASGIVYKKCPPGANEAARQASLLAWETHKDSERFLAPSPDRRHVLVSAQGEFELREISTGKVIWTLPNHDTERISGEAYGQAAWSPDGACALAYQKIRLTSAEREAMARAEQEAATRKEIEKKIKQIEKGEDAEDPALEAEKALRAEQAEAEKAQASGQAPNASEKREVITKTVLVRSQDGATIWSGPYSDYDWELYAAVGPKGQWAITAARGARFAVRDEKGAILRLFEPGHLPAEISQGYGLMAPLYLTGADANRFVLVKPDTNALYVMSLRIGTPDERAAAERIVAKNRRAIAAVMAEWKDGKKYAKWDDKYVEEFTEDLEVPAEAKAIVADKMKRMTAERRAGRKRDFRWLQPALQQFSDALLAANQRVIDKAISLQVHKRIVLPAIVCDAKADQVLKTAYVGLWDGTVRAYDLATGREIWKTEVAGGCQIAFIEHDGLSIVYAGGSRGDLYRLDGKTGKVEWAMNLTPATCSMAKR